MSSVAQVAVKSPVRGVTVASPASHTFLEYEYRDINDLEANVEKTGVNVDFEGANFTIAVWMECAPTNNESNVLSSGFALGGNASYWGWHLGTRGGFNYDARFSWQDAATPAGSLYSIGINNDTFATSENIFVVVTNDGSKYRIYGNGVLYDEADDDGFTIERAGIYGDIYVGSQQWPGGGSRNPLEGQCGGVYIWNGLALDAPQIHALMQESRAKLKI